MANIRTLEPRCRYTLTFRCTSKNFPKNKTIAWYAKKLAKKLKIKSNNMCENGLERGRYSLTLHYLTEREYRRISRIVDSIDDGILREVIVNSKIEGYY